MECLRLLRAASPYFEVRILPAQPPSRGFSGSLPTLAKASRRSPELRHQLVVFLSDLRPESASEQKNAATFPVYLYWAFCGVTLDDPADLVRCCLRIRCSQPPSRGISGPVPLFGRKVARSTPVWPARCGLFLTKRAHEILFKPIERASSLRKLDDHLMTLAATITPTVALVFGECNGSARHYPQTRFAFRRSSDLQQ